MMEHLMKSYKDPYYSEEEAVQQVGKGWEQLVRRVYSAKANIPIGIIQVKEKWGGLRIYTEHMHEVLDKIIQDAERESFTVCEDCGNPATLRKKGYWFKTLCKACGEPDWIPIKPF
jgi:hypothetical protein